MKSRTLILAALSVTAAAVAGAAAAGEKPVDRAPWHDADAQVSDDLRKVTVPKGFGRPKGAILISNARLFDGTGAAARPAAILIVDGVIARIGPNAASLQAPKDAIAIDAAGRTVMPGLIDLHTHLTYQDGGDATSSSARATMSSAALRGQERLRYFVESGVTSVRDAASEGDTPFELKQWVMMGRIPGPRIFPVGQLITGIGGHGTEGGQSTAPSNPDSMLYEANGPDGFREAVRIQFKRGADWIKLASHYSADEVKAAVDEAHALGLRVMVDSETNYIQLAVEAGADCIEHPLPRTDETIKLMASKGTCSDITLVPYQYINAGGGYNFSTSRRFSETDANNFATAKRLDAAGVKIGIGTDLVVDWYRYLPDAYIQELRNYETLGHTASQALVEATKINSEILGMSDRLGTIEAGKLADLIIVDGRPDQDVNDLAKLDRVIVNGRLVVEGGHVVYARHTQNKPLFTTGPTTSKPPGAASR
jgi:imidazolonepropionase-like amidohydrolase